MIFSGDESKKLWKLINKTSKKKNRKKLAHHVCRTLYLIGCKLQELETQIEKLQSNKEGT